MESESQDDREKRLQKLWKKLDTRDEGQLDLAGLKKGLKKMDHREQTSPEFDHWR
jgi:solute carrier family 25 phosphate transporter 23/24/25/41